MKKRILTAILALVICICMLPTQTLAAIANINNEPVHKHPVCGAAHTDIGNHIGTCADIEWTAWDGTDMDVATDGIQLTDGNYYLSSDLNLDSTVNVVGTVSLCLNGKVLKGVGGDSIINIQTDATMNLCDCKDTVHKFTPDSDGKWVLDEENGTKTVRGGVITGAYAWGKAIEVASVLNMYGGNVVGNSTIMYGSLTVSYSVNIYGGSICGNTGNAAIHLRHWGATSRIYGGDIHDNTVENGAVEMCLSSILVMSGAPEFYNNTEDIKYDWTCPLLIDGEMTNTNPIGLNRSLGTVIEATGTVTDLTGCVDNFESENELYFLQINGDKRGISMVEFDIAQHPDEENGYRVVSNNEAKVTQRTWHSYTPTTKLIGLTEDANTHPAQKYTDSGADSSFADGVWTPAMGEYTMDAYYFTVELEKGDVLKLSFPNGHRFDHDIMSTLVEGKNTRYLTPDGFEEPSMKASEFTYTIQKSDTYTVRAECFRITDKNGQHINHNQLENVTLLAQIDCGLLGEAIGGQTTDTFTGGEGGKQYVAKVSFQNGVTVRSEPFTYVSQLGGISAEGFTGAYDGNAHGITVQAPDDVTVMFGTTAGVYDQTQSPTITNAGTLTVYYQASKEGNAPITGSATVTITPTQAPAITFPEAANAITYGQQLKDAGLTFYENAHGTFNWNVPNSIPDAENDGYAVDFYPNDDALKNYDWASDPRWIASRKALCVAVDVVVNQAIPGVTAPTAKKNLVYTGDMIIPVNEGSADNGIVMYAAGTDATTAPTGGWSESVPEDRSAGTRYIWYKVVGHANYSDIAPACITVTITKAPLTVTAKDHTITYGDAPANNGVVYSGFVNNENVSVLEGTLGYTYSYAQFDDKGEYTITPKGLTAKNYEIAFADGKLTVAPKAITVTIDNQSSAYGKDIVTLTAQTDGIVNNDQNVYSLSTTATKTSAIGEYAITGTALDDNYDITFVNGKYNITKAEATVVEAPNAKTGLVYNKAAQALITAGQASGGKMVYSLTENGQYSETIPTGTDAVSYTVWYYVQGDNNHTDSAKKSVSVTIAKADPAIGAVTAGVVNDTLEPSAIILSRGNTTVKGTLAVDAGQSLAWGSNQISYTFTPENSTNYKIVTGEVTMTVADTIAPTGTVSIATDSWTEFLNTITFGLFFKETQTVTVVATDSLSGITKIEYASSDKALTLDQVKAITDWTEYTDSFGVTLKDAKKFVYFIRITDKAGNVSYLSTNGAEYDTTSPVISGIENGKTYYTTQKVTVIEKNVDTITLNNAPATESITLEGNVDKTYTIVAKDLAGNVTTVTVTMKPIRELSVPIDSLNKDNVNSGNESVVDGLEVIGHVEEVEDLIGKLPEKISKSDEAAIKAADEAYNALSDYEKSLVDANAKKALYNAKAALAELNKLADSPQTGDNSNLWLWFALLFVSGADIFGITLTDRKRKAASKR